MLDRLLSELRYRWQALRRRDHLDDDLDDEVRFHLEQEAGKLEAGGLSPEHARRAARLAFGTIDTVKDDARDARGVAWIEQTWTDLRYVCRGLATARAFTLGVAGTLALGIAVNVAVFGIVDRLMFRVPDALMEADRVHRLHLRWTEDGERRSTRSMAYPRLLDMVRDTRSFDRIAGFQVRTAPIGQGEDTREGRVAVITASYLDFFDAPPALGRWFTTEEDAPPAGAPVVVLSHAYWLTRYGGRADVLGQTLQVDRMQATIVGVAAAGFVGAADGAPPLVFAPMSAFALAGRGPSYVASYNWSWLEVLVRRAPGVTIESAQADATRAMRLSWRAENLANNQPDDVATAAPEVILGPVHLGRGPDAGLDARVAFWMAGVALVVLLIACANVTNLFLARATSRQREVAMRLALGVGRARLTRQFALESLVLGLLGGLGGVCLAWLAGGALRAALLPEGVDAAVLTDPRTVLYTLALAATAGAVTVIVPALAATRLDIAAVLKSGGRGATRPRTRTQAALVVVQAALSVVLLVSAAAFVLSLQRAQAHRLGFDVDRLLYAEVNMRGVRVGDAEGARLAARLEEATRSVPGVTHVTMAASVPFWSNEGRGLIVPGVEDVRARGRFTLQAGSTDYFAATGTRILRGRGFAREDQAGGALVMVVSEGMARALWPGADALGRCVGIDTRGPGSSHAVEPPCRTVVGVAEESAMMSLEPSRQFTYYVPFAQLPEAASPQFFVRVDGAPGSLAGALRARLQPMLPGAAYVNVFPLADLVAPQYRPWRNGATVFALFGVLALALAALGLHSLVAYEVAQREQEFGVRVALGASRWQVLRLVVGRGTRLTLAGIGIGVLAALAISGPLDAVLFHQSAGDPRLFAGIAVMLVVVAAVASLVPGVHATRVDPSTALRAD